MVAETSSVFQGAASGSTTGSGALPRCRQRVPAKYLGLDRTGATALTASSIAQARAKLLSAALAAAEAVRSFMPTTVGLECFGFSIGARRMVTYPKSYGCSHIECLFRGRSRSSPPSLFPRYRFFDKIAFERAL